MSDKKKKMVKEILKEARKGILVGIGVSAIYSLGLWKGFMGMGITMVRYLENEFPEDYSHISNVLKADPEKINSVEKYVPEMKGLMIKEIKEFKNHV